MINAKKSRRKSFFIRANSDKSFHAANTASCIITCFFKFAVISRCIYVEVLSFIFCIKIYVWILFYSHFSLFRVELGCHLSVLGIICAWRTKNEVYFLSLWWIFCRSFFCSFLLLFFVVAFGYLDVFVADASFLCESLKRKTQNNGRIIIQSNKYAKKKRVFIFAILFFFASRSFFIHLLVVPSFCSFVPGEALQ